MQVVQPEGYGRAFLTQDWVPLGDAVCNVGHDLETAELMYEAAKALADPHLLSATQVRDAQEPPSTALAMPAAGICALSLSGSASQTC